jgi:hypothetical protein
MYRGEGSYCEYIASAEKPKELHDFLPQHPKLLEKLVAHPLELKNPAILLLQSLLKEK